jgi:hypothetical protein
MRGLKSGNCGRNTGGGAHPQKPFAVGQGFCIFLCPLIVVPKRLEGTGVIPDFKTPASNALLKAQELVLKQHISHD